MKLKPTRLIAIATVAVFGSAFAQSGSQPGTSPSTPSTPTESSSTGAGSGQSSDVFLKLDSDKDGMVSKKEAASNKPLASKWKELDANKDGKLDAAEFARFEAEPPASKIKP